MRQGRLQVVGPGLRVGAILVATLGGGVGSAEQAATLKITTVPPGATVQVDDRYVGVAPYEVPGVAYGLHLVRAGKFRHVAATQKVAVDKPVVEVTLELVHEGQGSLRFAVKPDKARVFLNGQSKGETPLTLRELTPGRYEVRLEADWFLPWQGTVEVLDGQEVVVEQELESKTEAYLLAAIEEDPGRIVNYYDLGHLYARRQRFDEAFQAFASGFDACRGPNLSTNEMRRLYDEFERLWDGQYSFADDATRASLHARQVKALEAAIKRKPRNVLNYYMLSQFHSKGKDYASAAEVLERGWKAVKSRRCKLYLEHYLAYMRYQQGVQLQKQKEYDKQLEVLEALVAEHPKVWYTRSALTQIAAVWHSYKQDIPKAIEAKRRFLRLYPEADECPGVLASIASLYQSSLKDYQKARDAYRAHVDTYPENDNSPSYLLTLASLLQGPLKDPDRAGQVCRELLDKYPKHDLVPAALSTLFRLHTAAGRKDEAEAVRAKLLKDYPHSTQAAQLETDEGRKAQRQEAAKAYSAAAKLTKQDKAAAIAAYGQVAKDFPWTSYARTAQTRIIALWHAQKEWEKELEARREFIRLFPDDDGCASQQYQIGYVLCYQLERVEEGVAEWRRLIERYPDSDQCVTAQYNLASVYAYSGKHYVREKYLAENQRLIDDYPESDSVPGAQLNLSMNFYYRFRPGDLERGRIELRKVVDRYPWSWSCVSAEYYLDMLDAGMQLEENRIE